MNIPLVVTMDAPVRYMFQAYQQRFYTTNVVVKPASDIHQYIQSTRHYTASGMSQQRSAIFANEHFNLLTEE